MQSHLSRMPSVTLRPLLEELRGIDVPVDASGGNELWCPLAEHVVPEPQALKALQRTNRQLR